MASLIVEDRPNLPFRVSWRERGRQRTRRFATRKEAEVFIGDLARGQRATDASRLTLSDWLERWMTGHGVAWEPRTRRDRADFIDRLIEPHLGPLRLSEIGRSDVRQWRAELLREGKSAYTADRAVTVLSAALGAAVDDDLLPANPCRGLKRLPRPPQRRIPATLAEVERVRAAMDAPRDRLMVSLMAYAGLRPGELFTIRWEDVRDNTLVIRSARGEVGEKGTKTGSIRTVPVIKPLLDDLVAVAPGDGGLVLTGDNLEWHNWASRVWRPARVRARPRKGISPYSLRHTFASLLIAEGRNPWQVAALMGHANPQMVITTYGHLFAEAELAPPTPMEPAAIWARHDVALRFIDSAILAKRPVARRRRGAKGRSGAVAQSESSSMR